MAPGLSSMLRVLVANIPLSANRFLVDLNEALARQCEVVHGGDSFWTMTGEHDVVQLHFPEYLTYDIEASYRNGLTAETIDAVETRLRYWSGRASIVVTRHNLLPHDASADAVWERMYETVYRYADGVVHFAHASVEEFRERYRHTRFHRGQPLHAIIPHHNYLSLPNDTDRDGARKTLGIPRDASVMLVFGSIRGEAERQLVLDTFRGIRQPAPVLLVSRWNEKLAEVSLIRLKYWLRDITRLYYRLHPRYRLNYGFIEENDTQLYLNAADVLFIPRLHVLNSGNITLGMTFGRVVVGPDSWDVGELLRETGNPVFDPDRPETAAAAVDKGFDLARQGKVGAANKQLALSQWSADQCAERYVQFFRELDSRVEVAVMHV
ncbi:MAG: hypothetical protein H0U59_06615 [Gemmatimonadaceae bacterium]|nr:hypothetical protein [Gemmatimonadaceae bacterium]MDQ3242898.1 hypothetical protein [Gemmatimonadota bacterium]